MKKGGHESTRSKRDERMYKKQDGEKDAKREESWEKGMDVVKRGK